MNQKALLISLFVVGVASSASAQIVYGINANGPDRGIYKINMATGASTLAAPAVNASQPNGLAHDIANTSFYYCAGNGNQTLYRHNYGTNTTTQLTGSLVGPIASGAWYQGSFYYMPDGSGDLRVVTVSSTAIVSDTVLLNTSNNFSFGDIAISDSGVVYGSTLQNTFFKVDLNNLGAGLQTLSTNHGDRLQLGFFGNTLYGVSTDDDKLYQVSLVDGSRSLTATLGNTALVITDATSAPVPEPATLAALGLGLAAMARRRRARTA